MTGFLYPTRFFRVEFAGTSICQEEAKRYDSAFGNVADRSTIHFSLRRLTKLAGGCKKKLSSQSSLKTGSLQCGAVDIKRLYE